MNTRQGFWHRWRIFLRRVSFDSSKLQQVVWEDASIFKVAELDTEWYAVIDCQAHSNKALGIYPGHDDGCRPTGELVSLNGKDTPCSIYKFFPLQFTACICESDTLLWRYRALWVPIYWDVLHPLSCLESQQDLLCLWLYVCHPCLAMLGHNLC